MALSKSQKQDQVTELTQKMSEASSVIFANYIGLSVAEVSELRTKLREENAEMKVAKKTLMHFAAKDAKLPSFEDAELDGPVSLIFSYGDPLSGAQIAFKYSKEHKQVALIGGVFDGKVLNKDEALELAKMPNRDTLLAIFAGMVRSPLVSFANMSNTPLTSFARALSLMADKGGFTEEKAEAPSPAAEPKAPQAEVAEEAPAETPPATEAEVPAPETETPSEEDKKKEE